MARVVLGIETSCDETGAALVADDRRILAETVRTQVDEHALYGGVVPEIAARAHVESLDLLIAKVMAEAGLDFPDLAAIAATAGPGLIGGLLVGLTTAKAICLVHCLPLIAVNHLEAHALTARLTDDVAFPYLLLLVSGGHCQLVEVLGVGRYRRLGSTVDDALGEAFDKVAKMLGLGFPGGPAVERAAATGDPARFAFPRPMLGRPDCAFSFSGLKTAVRRAILLLGADARAAIPDLCASFQAAAAASVADRTSNALGLFVDHHPDSHPTLVVAGGVAANTALGPAPGGVAPAPTPRRPADRPTAPLVHRQRYHGRLDRHRAPPPGPHRPSRHPRPPPLAARPASRAGDRRRNEGGEGVIFDPKLEWDESKRRRNLERHGFDFADCDQVWRARNFVILPSDRGGEVRYRLTGMMGEQVVVLVWTPRSDRVRCISLRTASDAEKRQYCLLYPG